MERLKFNENDFNIHSDPNYMKLLIKQKAQAKFDEWFKQIENAPVVYGYTDHGNYKVWTNEIHVNDTHTARIIDIQEIKKECVKHEPLQFKWDGLNLKATSDCRFCGVELIAEFKEKK